MRSLYISIAIAYLSISTKCLAEETKTFTMARDFCEVEIRAGNHPAALDNPVISPIQKVSQGWSISTTQTFLFAQREANPGVCNSGRGQWISCSWDTCELN